MNEKKFVSRIPKLRKNQIYVLQLTYNYHYQLEGVYKNINLILRKLAYRNAIHLQDMKFYHRPKSNDYIIQIKTSSNKWLKDIAMVTIAEIDSVGLILFNF